MQGLTKAEVDERLARGQVNLQPGRGTPSVGRIVSRNVFTLFNGLNTALAALVLCFGHPKNALFMGVVVSNTLISIVQEVRAKRAVDKLAVLTQPHARVIRDGEAADISLEGVVLGDLLELSAGAQIPCDAEVVEGRLEVNEALLTGEPDAIVEERGALLLSGSFVVAGRGYARAVRVGADAFAGKLVREAGQKKNPDSPLMRSLRRVIAVLSIAIVPIFASLMWAKLGRDGLSVSDAVTGSVAAIIGMIPEGLLLLSGIALAAGVVALARKRTLAQSLPCVEMLARADVLCLDKTGTITDGRLTVLGAEPCGDYAPQNVLAAAAGILMATGDANVTASALLEHARQAGIAA